MCGCVRMEGVWEGWGGRVSQRICGYMASYSVMLCGYSVFTLFTSSSVSFSKLDVSSGIGGCPMPSEVKFDAIFIDIAGLRQFRSVVKARLQHYK